jgi:hypothetical protein
MDHAIGKNRHSDMSAPNETRGMIAVSINQGIAEYLDGSVPVLRSAQGVKLALPSTSQFPRRSGWHTRHRTHWRLRFVGNLHSD